MFKKDKNSFYEIIRQENLNPELFQGKEKKHFFLSFIEREKITTFTISLKNNHNKFIVKNESTLLNTFKSRYSFTEFLLSNWEKKQSLEKVLQDFRYWLKKYVKPYLEEINTPDFWDQADKYKSFVIESKINEENTTDFSEEEKENVRDSINKFNKLVEENFHPTEKQSEFIKEHLDYLSESANRLNRLDWRGLAISTFIAISINLSVDTERGRILWRLFEQAFQSTLKFLQ